jgi:hypothetical protein
MRFAQHQTFHIRDGWLRKGLAEVKKNPAIFTDPNAYLCFGLGKNMVEALRFWMRATGLTKEVANAGKRIQEITDFGKLIEEYDPYLEDDGSLWLIHYQLLKQPDEATAWYWFFNHYARLSFDREGFVKELSLWQAMQNVNGKEISKTSLLRDFDCFAKTYLPRQQSESPEDNLECPLVHLRLLSFENIGGQKQYHLNRPDPRAVPPLILLYVIKNWQEEHQPGALQVSLRDLLSSPCSPGRTFLLGMRLTEAIRAASEQVPSQFSLRLTRTSGLDVLTLPSISSLDLLKTHYTSAALSTSY